MNIRIEDSVAPTRGAEPIENAVLAMAYVPMQEFSSLYDPQQALDNGTLFADLDKPFLAAGGRL